MTKGRETKLKDKMKAQIIAACESVIRNADEISKNYMFDMRLTINIEMDERMMTEVTVSKTYTPKEVIDIITAR